MKPFFPIINLLSIYLKDSFEFKFKRAYHGCFITRPHVIYVLTSAAITSTTTYLVLYMDELSFSKEFITLVVALYSFSAFVASSLAGRGADSYGRKVFLKIGLLLAFLTFTAQFFASDAITVLLVRLLAGFSAGIYPPALIAFAYENKNRMGKFSSYGSVGFAVGSFLAGIIASFSTNWAFLLSGAFFLAAFLLALKLTGNDVKFTREYRAANHATPAKMVIKSNFIIYCSLFLRHSAAFAMWTVWPLFLRSLSFNNLQIGIVQSINALTQFLVMFLLADRIKAEKLYSLGLLATGITFITFLLTTNFYLFLLTQVILGFSWASTYVGAVKFVTERNQQKDRGTASGFLSGTLSVSGLVGPVYAFIFLLLVDDSVVYYFLILLAIVMSFISFGGFVIANNVLNGRKTAVDRKKARKFHLSTAVHLFHR